MIVRTRQRRTLAAMERQLRAGEPHLTAMFAIFARLTRDEVPAGPEPMAGHRGRQWPPGLRPSLPLGIAAALISLIVAVSARVHPVCGLAGYAPASAAGPAIAGCSPLSGYRGAHAMLARP